MTITQLIVSPQAGCSSGLFSSVIPGPNWH
jgi:hypothetical protein